MLDQRDHLSEISSFGLATQNAKKATFEGVGRHRYKEVDLLFFWRK
jgi:hypothetical protein